MPVSHAVTVPSRMDIVGMPLDEAGLNVAVVRLLALALDIS